MSEELLDTLWTQFAVETGEHIEAIELGLLEAEQSGVSKDLVSGLFRAFHSLKGLANAMDLTGMGQVAHRSEDIMGLVRDHGVPLTQQIVSSLLNALDTIKVLQQQGVDTHENMEPPADLLPSLVQLYTALKEGDSGSAAVAAEPSVTAAVQPQEQEQAVEPVALHEDLGMQEFFIELVKENIPIISRMLEPVCSAISEEGMEQCMLYADETMEALDRLEHAAQIMEFDTLVETFARVKKALPLQCPIPDWQRQEITECLRVLHEQISFIESATGAKDAGASQLAKIIKKAMQAKLDERLQMVLADLESLEGADDDLLIAESLHSNLAAASSHLAFFLPAVNCNSLLMLEDVFGRAARGELHIFNEIIEITRDIVQEVGKNYRQCAERKTCLRLQEEGPEAFRSNTIQRIHDYIWAYESGSGTSNPVEAFRQFMSSLDIDPELVKILSPENVRDLMEGIEKGEHIHEILAHLESNEEVAGRFLMWVENSGSRVITNRSVFIDGQSWYQMLMISPLPQEEVAKNLAEFDAENKYLKLTINAAAPKEEAEILKKMAAQAPVAPGKAQPSAASQAASNVLRIPGEMLDTFMNQIGEMVLARSRLNHILNDDNFSLLVSALKRSDAVSQAEISATADKLEEFRRKLLETDMLIHSTLGRLQSSAMGLRVVPVEMVFKRLPRLVRDLSQSLGKRIHLELSGQDVKIDKAMVEILVDPLLHMVKNSIDHGIELPEERKARGKNEEAFIRIGAVQQGNNISVSVVDDGRGIDSTRVLDKAIERGLAREEDRQTLAPEEIFRFLFQPGFSTATTVTETSGRGVGLDVVMTNVMRLGGSIAIDSQIGQGTEFHLRVPLSAAVQEVLLVEAAEQTLALPGRYVSEVLTIEAGEVQTMRGKRAILLRGTFLPLYTLASLMGFSTSLPGADRPVCLVVLTNGRQMIGIEVTRVLRRQELFTKDIQAAVAALPGVGGASSLGNGKVVLILDGEELLKLAKSGRG